MNRGKIMIVDDDSEIRRALRIALVAHGYEVAEARSGEEALATIQEAGPELVLLDLKLPGIGGIDTCRAIRASLDVPIVVISVRRSEQEKVDVLDAGADDYIVKPCGVDELLARIRAALRRPLTARDGPNTRSLVSESRRDSGLRTSEIRIRAVLHDLGEDGTAEVHPPFCGLLLPWPKQPNPSASTSNRKIRASRYRSDSEQVMRP